MSPRWLLGGKEHGQEPGEWFQLDLDAPLRLARIVLDHYGEVCIYLSGWARGLQAEISLDGQTWTKAEVSPASVFQFATGTLDPARPVRGIRFTTTQGHDPEYWGPCEVFACGPSR